MLAVSICSPSTFLDIELYNDTVSGAECIPELARASWTPPHSPIYIAPEGRATGADKNIRPITCRKKEQ